MQGEHFSISLGNVHTKCCSHSCVLTSDVGFSLPQLDVRISKLQNSSTVNTAKATQNLSYGTIRIFFFFFYCIALSVITQILLSPDLLHYLTLFKISHEHATIFTGPFQTIYVKKHSINYLKRKGLINVTHQYI